MLSAAGQTDSPSVYSKLDTLKFYTVSLFSIQTKGNTIYEVNKKKVNKATYMRYKKVWDNIDKCKPCVLQTYNGGDTLLYEAVQHTDCRVGWYIEYFPNGSKKVTGQYKENDTKKWKNLWNRGYCSKEHGTWKYYNEKGDLIKTEEYKNGKLK
jgi:antitoxin component YwqK of YwqJK toxin-antitoxin module